MKPVMAFLDRVVSLIARGLWHWDWWPLEEGAWPLQIMEKVMVDSNFRRRSWWIPIFGEGHGGFQFSEKAMAAFQETGEGRGGLH